MNLRLAPTLLFLAALGLSPAAGAQTIVVDASAPDGGVIPAIHGVTNGPVISGAPGQEPPCQNHHPADHSSTFVELQIPQVRTHGGAETDMNLIWLPYPNYLPPSDPAYADPADPANYDWTRADEAIAQIVSAGGEPFIRIGQSKNGAPGAPCDPSLDTTAVPADMAVFGEVVRRILMHFTQGWDNGHFYDIKYVEIWNEFWEPAFWSGTGVEAAQLYEATYDAVKPSFPGIKLGPSINKPVSPSSFAAGFWDYIRNNSVPVDFVNPHLYVDLPRTMEQRIHEDPIASWEALFAQVGLPADTEIVNSEWNRSIGCSLEGGAGNTIPGGAFVAGALIAMANMHPANSTHNLVMSHLFSTRSQIWRADLVPKAPGVGLEAYAQLVIETPEKLQIQASSGTPSTAVDFRAMAGRSPSGDHVNLLVSYYDTSATSCPDNSHTATAVPLSIDIQNLPWGSGDFFWERWVHSSNTSLSLAESGAGNGGRFVTNPTMHANVFEIYTLKAVPAVPTTTAWLTALGAGLIAACGAIALRRRASVRGAAG